MFLHIIVLICISSNSLVCLLPFFVAADSEIRLFTRSVRDMSIRAMFSISMQLAISPVQKQQPAAASHTGFGRYLTFLAKR